MPMYEYYCPANEQTIEVEHGMRTTRASWGELCAAAALDLGPTPAGAHAQ